jgi:hypothetical protein
VGALKCAAELNFSLSSWAVTSSQRHGVGGLLPPADRREALGGDKDGALHPTQVSLTGKHGDCNPLGLEKVPRQPD